MSTRYTTGKHLLLLPAALLLASVPAESARAFGATRPGWPQTAKGDPVHLTYSYENLLDGGLRDPMGQPVPVTQIRTAVEEAFGLWAAVAPLHFTEVYDDGLPYGQSQDYGTIRLRHIYINGPDPPDGPPTTKATASFPGTSPGSGDINFDRGDPWALVGTYSEPDILGLAAHEIGHALGVTHTGIEGATMYWIALRHDGPGTGYLHADDIAAIRSIYGAGVGSVTPLATAIPEPGGLILAALGATGAVALRAGRRRRR